MKAMKILISTLYVFVLINLALIFSGKSFVVLTGSMKPQLSPGSMIFVRRLDNYSNGDIITYKLKNNIVTHRIIKKLNNNEFFTKGDANGNIDDEPIILSAILGKVLLVIPFLGYFYSFISTLSGFILFIIVPSFVYIIHEIFLILKELRKLTDRNYSVNTWHKVVLSGIIISFFYLSIIPEKIYAYLNSTQVISGNLISTALSQPLIPQVPGDLFINEFVPNPASGNKEWVEIYNPGPESFDLTGSWIEDSVNNPKTLSSLGTINANSNVVLEVNEGWLNNNNGDALTFKNPDGTVIDSIIYTNNFSDEVSMGRSIDGGSIWKICTVSTKGLSNSGGC